MVSMWEYKERIKWLADLLRPYNLIRKVEYEGKLGYICYDHPFMKSLELDKKVIEKEKEWYIEDLRNGVLRIEKYGENGYYDGKPNKEYHWANFLPKNQLNKLYDLGLQKKYKELSFRDALVFLVHKYKIPTKAPDDLGCLNDYEEKTIKNNHYKIFFDKDYTREEYFNFDVDYLDMVISKCK